MASLRRKLRDRAVYWAPEKGSVSGQYTFLAPVEVCCHWEDVQVEFLDRAGNKQLCKSRVFCDTDLSRLGVLWKGCLKDLADGSGADATSPDPFLNADAYEVRQCSKIPSVRSTDSLFTAYL